MDVGTTFRKARERQDRTIEEIARSTKISSTLLAAIEREQFDKLPGGIFGRGFIRAYAKEVGLDPEEMVAAFVAHTGLDTNPEPDLERAAATAARPSAGRSPGVNAGTWATIAALLLLVVALATYSRTAGPADPAMNEATVPRAPGATDSGPGVQAAIDSARPGAAPEQAVATDGGLLRFELTTDGPCWVEVVADGRTVVYRLMQPGEREAFEARGEVTLFVGDPSALAFSINGQPGRVLGRPGVPARVRLTGDTYQRFLAD